MKTLDRGAARAGLGALIMGLTAAALAADPAIPTYRAVYEVEYKGKRVGSSHFSVSHDPANRRYRFESVSSFRGMIRLARPKPVIERSEFTIHDGAVRPMEFQYRDGSRSGEDDFHVAFDWHAGLATTTREDRTVELELRPGVLDRGSMQVAAMADMAAPGGPDRYVLADEDALRTYRYSPNGSATLETGLGSIDALGFIQQREGSSRRTLIWAAPELRYLPVRIEQQRDGETRTAFILQSVQWLDTNPE
jgi:hypothetical protein